MDAALPSNCVMKKTLVRLAIALPLLVGALLLILKLTGDEPAKGQTEPAAQKTEHVVPKNYQGQISK